MNRWMPRLALTALAVAAFLTPGIASAAPASAAVVDPDALALCEQTNPVVSGELVQLDPSWVPPPLRSFEWTCASTTPGASFDADGVTYDLVWVDADFSMVLDILRSFERAGWGDGFVSTVDLGDGPVEYGGISADELAALDETPIYAHARFSNEQTRRDIITIYYTDGDVYSNDVALTAPSLFIQVFANAPYDATGFGDPSVLSTLKTVQDAAITPAQGTVLAGTAVILTLIVGYPGSLLGSVISARYDRLAAAVRARWRRAAGPPDQPQRRMPTWLIWPGFVAAAILGGFVDPAFGLNWMSLRVLLTGLLSFAVFNVGVWTLVKLVMRRVQPDARPYIKFRWGSLLIIAVAVVVARLLEFNPGVIFGLVAGLAFGMSLASSRNAMVILLGSGFGLLAAALAWVGYSALAPLGGANAAVVFLSEFFSGVTLEGISTLPLALLPLARLDGATLLRWKKWVWGLAYAVGVAAFMFVLFTVPGSWAEIPGDFVRWVVLFVVFGVVSVAVWAADAALARRKAGRGDEVESETELQR